MSNDNPQNPLFDDLPALDPGIPAHMRFRGGVSVHDAGHSQLVYRFSNDWRQKGHIENLTPGRFGERLEPGEFGIVFQQKLDGDLVPFDLVARTVSGDSKLFIKVVAAGKGRSQTSMYRLIPYLMQASSSKHFRDGIYLVLIGDFCSRLAAKFPVAERDLKTRNRRARKRGGGGVLMLTYSEFFNEQAVANRFASQQVLPG